MALTPHEQNDLNKLSLSHHEVSGMAFVPVVEIILHIN